jgi:hypothetical protein
MKKAKRLKLNLFPKDYTTLFVYLQDNFAIIFLKLFKTEVIYVKNFKRNAVITVLTTLAVLLGLTLGTAMLLIPAVLGSVKEPAGEDISGIPYSSPPPSQTLLILDEKDRGALVHLNFAEIVTHVYILESDAETAASALPYDVTYTMKISGDFPLRLCDRIGGIEIENEGVTERYFSASLSDFCGENPDYGKMLKISRSFFEKIANMGLSSEDFMFIIEVSDTDLTYSVCYGWIDRVPEMFSNVIYH